MKGIRGILILIGVLLGPMVVWAEENHYFGIAFQGGYATMHPFGVDVQPLHGMAGGGTLLYEYQHNHFIMDIGAGFNWQQTGWCVDAMQQLPNQKMTDSQGDDFILKTSVRRWDEVRRGVIDIPLLFGGEWGRAYLLGGVKVGIGMVDRSRLKGEITTTGEYEHYFVPIHDAAIHGFYTAAPIEQSYAFPSQLDARLSMEAGVRIARAAQSSNATVKVRLGAFIDYGLFQKKVDLNPIMVTHEGTQMDLSAFHMQSILVEGSHWMDNLLAGVKLTILIGGASHVNCSTCRILDNDWHPLHGKKRCITCERTY